MREVIVNICSITNDLRKSKLISSSKNFQRHSLDLLWKLLEFQTLRKNYVTVNKTHCDCFTEITRTIKKILTATCKYNILDVNV
jgi:hypothetical protein